MADENAPISGSGHQGIRRAAKKALDDTRATAAELTKAAEQTDAFSLDAVQAQKKLSDAQRRFINALNEGREPNPTGRFRAGEQVTFRALERRGLARMNVGVGPELTELGRAVAARERLAAETARLAARAEKADERTSRATESWNERQARIDSIKTGNIVGGKFKPADVNPPLGTPNLANNPEVKRLAERLAAERAARQASGDFETVVARAELEERLAGGGRGGGGGRRPPAPPTPPPPPRGPGGGGRDLVAYLERQMRRLGPLQPRESAGGGARDMLAELAARERFLQTVSTGDFKPTAAQMRPRRREFEQYQAEAQRRNARIANVAMRAAQRPSAGGGAREVIAAMDAQERFLTSIGAQAGNPTRRVGTFLSAPPRSAGGGGRDVVRAIDQQLAAVQQRQTEMDAFLSRIGGTAGETPNAHIGPFGGESTKRGLGAFRQSQRQQASDAAAAATATEQHAQNVRDVALYEQQAAQRTQELNRLYNEQRTILGGTSQAYYRHGALTTEFLSAAARGEATFRELGSQVGLTTAKFAGWTAVSVPIFALATAVGRVGTGAIESASGVDQLKRVVNNVNGGQAQQQFRSLSEQFNVPIGDAADAVYRMGQVFHNQADAVKAARVALYAYQTGELSVEDSTKRLIAVQQGFGLSAGDLVTIYDQVNAAQNRFGATIPDTLSGLGRLAGAFRNAGGDASYALSLLVTGQKVTGRTGENIGTAIQRSVGFIQRPTNQARLREFGIDPTKGIDQVFEQAFKVAQGLQGQQLQQLATALSSPQYASYFVPILQNRQRFLQIQQTTSPQASQGSARNELATRLHETREQIGKVGNQLEQLGSNLYQSGLVSGLGLVLRTTNGLLTVTNNLLGLFNRLPDPVRTMLSGLLQVRLVLGGLRRFNFGDALPGRLGAARGFLNESPERTQQRLFARASRDAVAAGRDRAATSSAQAFTAISRARAQDVIAQADIVRINRQLALGELTEAEAVAARKQAYERVAAAQAEATTTAQRARVELALAAEAEQDRVRGPIYGTLERPVTQDAETASRIRGDIRPQEGFIGGGFAVGVNGAERAMAAEEQALQQQLGGQTRTQAVRLTDARRRLAQTLRQDAQAVVTMGVQGGAVGAASSVGAIAATRGAVAFRGAAIGMRGLAAAGTGLVRSIFGFLGPVGLAITALSFLPSAISGIRNRYKQADDARKRIERINSGQERYRNRSAYADARKRAQRDVNDTIGQRSGVGGLFQDFLDVAVPGRDDRNTARAQAGQAFLDRDARRRAAQAQARFDHRPVPQLSGEALQRHIDDDFRALDNGTITLAQLRKRMADRFQEIDASLISDQAQGRAKDQYQRRLLQASSSRRGFTRQLLDPATQGTLSGPLADTVEGLQALQDAGIASRTQTRNLIRAQLHILARNRGKSDAAGRQAYAGAYTNLKDILSSLGKDELDSALAVADSAKDRRRAYSDYLSTVRTGGLAAVRKMRAELKRQQADISTQRGADQTRLDATQLQIGGGDFGLRGGTIGLLGVASGLQARIKGAGTALTNRAKEIRRINKALDQVFAAINKEIAAAQQESADAKTGERLQEQAAQIQANANLAAAQAGSNQGAALGAQLTGAQNLLAFARAHRGNDPGEYKGSQITDLQAQVVQLQTQAAEQAAQDARDLISARFNLRRAGLDNAVGSARLNLQESRAILGAGGFRTAAERINAQADARQKAADLESARSQRRVENIDLQHDIGKLSDDAYIQALTRQLNTLKKGSDSWRELHGRILRFKHDMNESSDFDLGLGDIKVPSLYEVKRFIKGGTAGSGGQVNANTSVTINVHGRANAKEVADQVVARIGHAQRTTVRAAARAGNRR